MSVFQSLPCWGSGGLNRLSKIPQILGIQKKERFILCVSINWRFIVSIPPCCPIIMFTFSKITHSSSFPESVFPLFISFFFFFHSYPSPWQGGRTLGINSPCYLVTKVWRGLKFWDYWNQIPCSHSHCQLVKTKWWLIGHL